jgi:hypothetical protein
MVVWLIKPENNHIMSPLRKKQGVIDSISKVRFSVIKSQGYLMLECFPLLKGIHSLRLIFFVYIKSCILTNMHLHHAFWLFIAVISVR